ncbi:hypothetical protein ANN_10741 [Periplaneta americana]|uniref:Uncharacterized protein n=1 Tax=Periplaneta americana TaxID=6978 RepID=A0ABQ8T350_PERAM|nr:hypothetical protein ANN_10741 [Periplaneta americana]
MGPSLSRHKMMRRHVLYEIFHSKGGVIALWGTIKQHVSKHQYQTIEGLKQVVRKTFREITPPLLRKFHTGRCCIILCCDNDGPILMFWITKQAGTRACWTLCTLTCYHATCGHHILLEVNDGSSPTRAYFRHGLLAECGAHKWRGNTLNMEDQLFMTPFDGSLATSLFGKVRGLLFNVVGGKRAEWRLGRGLAPRIDVALVSRGIDGSMYFWLKMQQIQARKLRTDSIDLRRLQKNITGRRRNGLQSELDTGAESIR